MSENCPTCGSDVTIEGRTTQYYVPKIQDTWNQDFLKRLGTKIVTQDNRMTAAPYLHVLQEMKQQFVRGSDRYDKMVFEDSNGDIWETEKDYHEMVNGKYSSADKHNMHKQLLKQRFLQYTWEDVNWFLTLEAAEKHAVQNRHRYSQTRIFIKHCDNTEIAQLWDVLIGLAK
jgi:hypothetical protein